MADTINDLAGFQTYGPVTQEQLYAGEAPITTDAGPAAAAVLKYQVCVRMDDGTVTPYVPGTTGHTVDKLVIAAQPVPLAGQQVPYFSGGYFNHALLIWPGTLTTYAQRKALFTESRTIKIGHITR